MALLKGKCGWTDRHGKVEYSTRAFNRKVDQSLWGKGRGFEGPRLKASFAACLLGGLPWASGFSPALSIPQPPLSPAMCQALHRLLGKR